MNIIGTVKELTAVDDEALWNSHQLYIKRDDQYWEVQVTLDEVCTPLANFLKKASIPTSDYSGNGKKKRIYLISLAVIRNKLCETNAVLKMLEKKGNPIYLQYHFYFQLKELVRQIDMIVELSQMKDTDIFLHYYYK